MSIGDKSIIPQTPEQYFAEVSVKGLTYREWLIGMLASNPMVQHITTGEQPFFEKTWSLEKTASNIVRQADAIINQLDKEVEK